MFGIGEVILLIVVLVFAGGLVSRVAKWALYRRAPGAQKFLSAAFDWIERKDLDGMDGEDQEEPPPSARKS